MISPINFTQTTDFWIFSRSTVDEVMLSPFFLFRCHFPEDWPPARAARGLHGAPFPLEIVGLIPWGQQDQDMTNAPNPFILGRSGMGNPAVLRWDGRPLILPLIISTQTLLLITQPQKYDG